MLKNVLSKQKGKKMKKELSFSVVPISEVYEWIHSLHMMHPSHALAILLAGDRLSCCEEAVICKLDNFDIVGIATMSFAGEQSSGQPTIVGVYVLHSVRQHGIGRRLFEKAVMYMLEKGVVELRLDVLNSRIFSFINQLPEEIKSKLQVLDACRGKSMDDMMEF